MFLSGDSREKLISLSFPVSRNCPKFLTNNCLPYSKLVMVNQIFVTLHHIVVEFSALSSMLKACLGLNWVNKDNVWQSLQGHLISNLNSICKLNIPLPCYLIYSELDREMACKDAQVLISKTCKYNPFLGGSHLPSLYLRFFICEREIIASEWRNYAKRWIR